MSLYKDMSILSRVQMSPWIRPLWRDFGKAIFLSHIALQYLFIHEDITVITVICFTWIGLHADEVHRKSMCYLSLP